MKAKDAVHQLEKLIKLVRKDDITKSYFYAKFRGMIDLCKELNLKEEKKILHKLMFALNENTLRKQYIDENLKKLNKSFARIVEKEKVMQLRETKALVGFYKKTKNVQTANVLQYGDIVKVPTQGGYHFSIVVGIHNDMVECIPLTTAPEEDLQKLGLNSIAIEDFLIIDGVEQKVRLTSAKTKLPVKCVACNKIGTYADINWLKEAVANLIKE